MLKRPFLIFMFVMAVMIAGLVAFMQSARFAGVVKRVASQYVPEDIGVDGDFTDFSLQLIPPAVSINHPRISLNKRNVLDLPEGSSVSAERIDLEFRPFQMFTGNIMIHRATIVNGDVRLSFDREFLARKKRSKKITRDFHWDQLLQVRAESIVLQDTHVDFKLASPAIEAELTAKYLRLAQWSGPAGMGYETEIDLRDLSGSFPQGWTIPGELDQVRARARVNALGLEVHELSVQDPGLEIIADGAVKGNIAEPKTLLTEGRLKLEGDLARLRQLPALKSAFLEKAQPRGKVRFEGKLKGDLEKAADTFRVDGALAGEQIRFLGWEADQLAAEGTWIASPSGGEISIAKASIFARDRARAGNRQGASGGRIELGAFRFRPAMNDSFAVPVALERAHLQWLGAPALKQLFPVGMRISGPVQLVFTPAKGEASWGLKGRIGLKVDDFQLDNQKLGMEKPLKVILKAPTRFQLEGDVEADANGIRWEALNLGLPRSKLRIRGGVDFEKGLDIHGTGPVNLADIGQIAENDIRGEGTLTAHAHGPFERLILDFDADMKDAYYIKLRLGDFRGRVTWDDEPSHLLISNAVVKKGETVYTGGGMLDLGTAETIDLNIKIPRGDIRDFSEIFRDLTSDLSWYPSQLNGRITGVVGVGGGLDLSRLKVLANIEGIDWEYLGEKFRSIYALAGFDRGKYQIETMNILKQTGRISGRVSYDANERMEWDLKSDQLNVLDLDHVARLDVPIRGRISLQSSGQGKEGSIESITRATLSQLSVRGVGMADSELSVKSSGGIAQVNGLLLGGQGRLDANYNFKKGASSKLQLELSRLDFTPILLLLNPKAIQDPSLYGMVSGSLDLAFRSGEIERGTGKAVLGDFVLAKTGARFELLQPVQAAVDRGTFAVRELVIRGLEGATRIRLSGDGSELEGGIEGDIDIRVAEFFTPVIAQSKGVAELDIEIGGSLKEPSVFGTADLSEASIRIPSIDATIEDIGGTIQIRQNVIQVQDLEGDFATGRVAAEGTIRLFADRYPELNLHARLNGPRLRIFPFQFVKTEGTLHVHGAELPYVVDGKIVVPAALSTEKMLTGSQQGPGLKTAKYMPPPTARREGDLPRFKLNIGFESSGGVLIKNDLFDAEFRARGTVVNTIETPRIVGEVELAQGKLMFKDRVFQIQSARLSFDNPTVMNPAFNLTAGTEVGNARILLYTAGRLDNYKIELNSNPAMSESEILTLLTIGSTSGVASSESRRARPIDRGMLDQSEAASLVLSSTDFNRDLQSKTGLQIQIDEAVNTQLGASAFRPQSASDVISAPKIVIKRQIGRKIDLSVGSTVGVGSGSQQQLNAEVKVSPAFSIIGAWDSLSGADNSLSPQSYGVDLRVQKRFK